MEQAGPAAGTAGEPPPARARSRIDGRGHGGWSRLPLPRGRSLDPHEWRRRHEAIVLLVAGHAAGIAVFGIVRGYSPVRVLVAALPVAIAAVGGHVMSGRRGAAMGVTSVGLLTASAAILYLSGGTVEANFHFLVALGVVSLYQDWFPFLLALVFVIVHQFVVGFLDPRAIYSHPAAWDDPFTWGLIRAAFVMAVSAVNVVSWRLAEGATQQVRELSRRHEQILDAAGEGIYGTDTQSLFTFVNPAAARMIGMPAGSLIGMHSHDVLHHSRPDGAPYLARDCPIAAVLSEGNVSRGSNEVFWRADGTPFPVEYQSTPLVEAGEIVGSVVTFDDISERVRAREAERELTRLGEVEHAQREALHHLQETLRPPKPEVDHTELGVHYLPAEVGAPAGGDLYDWQVLPDGALHVAVIDVVGKGVTATKDALAVAHALRLSALAGRDIGDLVAGADALVTAQSPELVATVMIARYDPNTGVVRLAGASHPPALYVTAEGKVREVMAPGIAIGWPGASSDGVVELRLDRNDSLILYTDGLVEANKDLVSGLKALAREAEDVSRYPADVLARSLVERMLARGSRRDDTLALVIRRRTPPLVPGKVLGPFTHRFRANEAVVPLARHLLDDWLRHQPVDPAELDDVPLIVSELCSNAVRAARTQVVLRAWAEGNSLVVEVEDDGGRRVDWDPSDPDADLPDPGSERGRGLFLAEALSDELTVRSEPGRTVVRAVKFAMLAAGR